MRYAHLIFKQQSKEASIKKVFEIQFPYLRARLLAYYWLICTQLKDHQQSVFRTSKLGLLIEVNLVVKFRADHIVFCEQVAYPPFALNFLSPNQLRRRMTSFLDKIGTLKRRTSA